MSRTDELIRLAEEATDWDCNTIRAFQENATPQTIKQMVLLMKQMAKVLKMWHWCSKIDPGVSVYAASTDEALAAYERFEKGE